ncbi:MAG: OmpA family protein [Acidimicrobiia bacterium]
MGDGFGSFGQHGDIGGAHALGIRGRFIGDAVGWALGAALVLLLGVVGVAGYRLVSHSETVHAPLPEFSAEAAAWLAGQQEIAVYRDGRVYLYGVVASDAERQEMIDLAGRVLGAENVDAEQYYVDSTATPRTGSATMRVADPVLFEFDSAVIAPGFEPVLSFVAALMQQNPAVVIEVIGHTDDVGTEQDNLELSAARADAGVAAIVARGGDRARISGVGHGESEPIASNSTEEGRRMNRRVEFVLSGLGG